MSKLEYRNLDLTQSFSNLKKQKPFDIINDLTGERIEKACIKEAGSLCYNYGAMPVDDKTISPVASLTATTFSIFATIESARGEMLSPVLPGTL